MENKIVLTDEQIDAVAYDIQGTCMTSIMHGIRGVLENDELDESDIAPESIVAIEDMIFNCSSCGWWYESPDEGDGMCESCYEEANYEDEEEE